MILRNREKSMVYILSQPLKRGSFKSIKISEKWTVDTNFQCFSNAHLVLHYQVNLVGFIVMKAKIDMSTLVIRKTKDSLFYQAIVCDLVIVLAK